MNDEEICRANIEKMLKRSQTKVIFPIITLALVQRYCESGQRIFSDTEIRRLYEKTVNYMRDYLQHDLHIGGKYYDAYPSRNLPKYGVLKALGNSKYELLKPYRASAETLCKWIPIRIKTHIDERMGMIPSLGNREVRAQFSLDSNTFLNLLKGCINTNATNFEIVSFAVIKVHLEKFACKIYRDTRTSANDKGVDLSTNFGVVYQIKKLKVYNRRLADDIYQELKINFDRERLNDGNVIIVIDDISKEVKNYLIDMKIQSISTHDLMNLAEQFEDVEDREKILRIIYDEFRREYSSSIKLDNASVS
jgi:hypothetical protein